MDNERFLIIAMYVDRAHGRAEALRFTVEAPSREFAYRVAATFLDPEEIGRAWVRERLFAGLEDDDFDNHPITESNLDEIYVLGAGDILKLPRLE